MPEAHLETHSATEPQPITLAGFLRKAMEARRLTHSTLAHTTGIVSRRLFGIMRGDLMPESDEEMRRLAYALDIEPGALQAKFAEHTAGMVTNQIVVRVPMVAGTHEIIHQGVKIIVHVDP